MRRLIKNLIEWLFLIWNARSFANGSCLFDLSKAVESRVPGEAFRVSDTRFGINREYISFALSYEESGLVKSGYIGQLMVYWHKKGKGQYFRLIEHPITIIPGMGIKYCVSLNHETIVISRDGFSISCLQCPKHFKIKNKMWSITSVTSC